LDVAVVTSKQLSASPGLTGLRWTSLLSLIMTQIYELPNSKPSSNIVIQLIMKIKARVSSQQKQYPVKIPVQRSQSIYLNPSAGGLCQNCSYKLRTDCRAHIKGGSRERGRDYGHLARSQVVRRHSDMGLVRGRPGPEAFVTFRGQTMEEAGSEHDLERANEDARRIWLNRMTTRNRISRVTQETSANGKRDRARDVRDNSEDHIYEEITPGHKQTDDD